MIVAYVAGPYRSKSKMKLINRMQVICNIIRARAVARELWKLGYATFCPHSNTALFDGNVPDEVVLQGDIEILKRCDIIVMQGKWEDSKGSLNELLVANKNKIKTYEWDGKKLVRL